MTTNTVSSDRGPLLTIKKFMPRRVWRLVTRPFAWALRAVPGDLKFSFGLKLRRGKYPYKIIRKNDIVVQIGAPRDLLAVGRSRFVYFAMLAVQGKVVVIEPDPDNVAAIRAFATRKRIENRLIVIDKGAWSGRDRLEFLSNPNHPASNTLAEVPNADDSLIDKSKFNRISVEVDAVDNVFAEHALGAPKLVSITTNGAEREILEGMKQVIAMGCEYISLAVTEEGYEDLMESIGFKLVGYDDRGFTFRSTASTS